jgi:hypothetical protein
MGSFLMDGQDVAFATIAVFYCRSREVSFETMRADSYYWLSLKQ